MLGLPQAPKCLLIPSVNSRADTACGASQTNLHYDPFQSLDTPNGAVTVTSYDTNLELWSD